MKFDISTDFGEAHGPELEKLILRAAISAQFEIIGFYEVLLARSETGEIKSLIANILEQQKTDSRDLWAVLKQSDKKPEDEIKPEWRGESDDIDRGFELSH